MRETLICLCVMCVAAYVCADDPKQVALDYHDAIVARDVERVKSLALVPQESAGLFEAQLARLTSEAAVEAAAKRKNFDAYENPALHPGSDAAIHRRGLKNAEVTIDGDRAIIKTGTNPDFRQLQRVNGSWLIDWQHYQRGYAQVTEIAAYGLVYSKEWTEPVTRANARLLKEINDGTITSAAQLSDLRARYVFDEQLAVRGMAPAGTPASQPATHPATGPAATPAPADLNAAYNAFFDATVALYQYISDKDGPKVATQVMWMSNVAEVPDRNPPVQSPIRKKDVAAGMRNRNDTEEMRLFIEAYRARAAARVTVLEELRTGVLTGWGRAEERLKSLDYAAGRPHLVYRPGKASPSATSKPAQ